MCLKIHFRMGLAHFGRGACKLKKYYYTTVLLCSFVIVFLLKNRVLVTEPEAEQSRVEAAAPAEKETTGMQETAASEDGRKEPAQAEDKIPETEPVQEPVTEPESSQTPADPVSREHYFDDTLFIGDSRTVGLSEYADLGDAWVFANSGMSVYKIFSMELPGKDQQKRTLEALLQEKSFGKIYIMLGINELGYNYDSNVKKYEEMISIIAELQPQAKIILEANMHLAAEKSNADPVFNNSNINRFNGFMKELASENDYQYLDINERFDDETGNLDDQYTVDEAHLLGKYYSVWADWIYEKGQV